MVRTIITPLNTDVHLLIEKEYVGKQLEITYLALDEIEHKPTPAKTMASFWNCLSDDAAQKLHENVKQMRSEWEGDI